MSVVSRGNTRKEILQKALEIAANIGTRQMTLEAVAEQSGISKGGLLYHFPNKTALIEGLLTHLIEDSRQRREAVAHQNQDYSWLMSFLAARIRRYEEEGPEVAQSAFAILVAANENPELLSTARSPLRTLQETFIEESNDPTMALIVWLASEGLALQDLLSISPLTQEERQKILARLFEIASENRSS